MSCHTIILSTLYAIFKSDPFPPLFHLFFPSDISLSLSHTLALSVVQVNSCTFRASRFVVVVFIAVSVVVRLLFAVLMPTFESRQKNRYDSSIKHMYSKCSTVEYKQGIVACDCVGISGNRMCKRTVLSLYLSLSYQ